MGGGNGVESSRRGCCNEAGIEGVWGGGTGLRALRDDEGTGLLKG